MNISTGSVNNQLRLQFLGAPQVFYQGRPLRFRSRKVLALLIYLVVTQQPHNREILMTLLWPNSDRRHAQTSLRNAIATLRRSLRIAGEFLVVEQDMVGFNFEQPHELDLRQIERSLQADNPDAWRAAVGISRGEFLAGFSLADAPDFDDWAAVQREWWHQRVEVLFKRLCRYYFDSRENGPMAETARLWLAHAPLSESAHRALIKSYLLAGRRSAALQVYEDCRTMLAAEFGVEPAPETMALAQRAKNLRLRHDESNRKAKISKIPERGQNQKSKIEPLPLIGRAEEHGQLVSVYRRAGQGETRAMVIIGEAGLGKTRLVEAFLAWLAIEEPTVDILRGQAFEMGGQLPYQPLIDAVRQRLDQENAPDDLLSDVWLAELSQLLPELRERYPDLPQPVIGDSEFVRARLFEAVTILGLALAERQLLVLFIDDLHWADEGTLEMLHYLARRWAEQQTPVLLLVTLRLEALMTTPELKEWLMHLGRDLSLSWLDLETLPQPAVVEFIRALAQADDDTNHEALQAFAGWLLSKTGGVPFFMEEIWHMLVEQGMLVAEQQNGQSRLDIETAWAAIQTTNHISLPPGIREVIMTRLGRLPDEAARLLLAGSVLGRECSFDRLCQVSGLDELVGLPALEVLLNSRLLLEIDNISRPYRLAHDNIREVVYTQASAAHRRVYHRRAFNALEQAQAPAAELAFHASAAQLKESTFHYSITAGDEAATVYAIPEALAHYTRALELVEQVEGSSDDLVRLFINYPRALEINVDFETAMAHYEWAVGLSSQRENKALRLVGLTGQIKLSTIFNIMYNPQRGQELSEEALLLARQLEDHAAEAKILWSLMLAFGHSLIDLPLAIRYGEQALSLARKWELDEQLPYTLNDLGRLIGFSGRLADGRVLMAEARALFEKTGNLPLLIDNLDGYCNLLLLAGEFETALAYGEEALELSQSIGNMFGLGVSLWLCSWIYTEQADFKQALAGFELLLESPSPAALHLPAWGQVYLALGQIDAAMTRFEAELPNADELGPMFGCPFKAQLARLYIARGDLQAAEEPLLACGLDPDQEPLTPMLSGVFLADAELAFAQGHFAQTITKTGRMIAAFEQAGQLLFLPDVLLLKAKAILALEPPDLDAAQAVLTNARTVAEATGWRRELWRLLALLADVEGQRENKTAATNLRHEARTALDYVIEHIPEGELQASFMALPEVKAIN